jgi:hypothetical protein
LRRRQRCLVALDNDAGNRALSMERRGSGEKQHHKTDEGSLEHQL